MSAFATHDVKRFVISRPAGVSFEPGQGVELAIDRPQWCEQFRPFTPTGYADDRVLEFTIKGYPMRDGVTRELHRLSAGAELLMSDPFGTIHYRRPGVFIAGGAGITPFLAILRERARAGDVDRNALVFSNKTPADIICEKELRHYLGNRCLLLCTADGASGCARNRVDKDYLAGRIEDFGQDFYVCGPPGFVQSVNAALEQLGADPQNLVFER